MVTKDTKVCISIATRPGNFGATFHNKGYQLLNLDYVYLPRKITSTDDLKQLIDSVRLLEIKGCSVSMPHKEHIMQYLDEVDPAAKKIGAINTIVNEGGKLTGFNTDYFGVKKAISEQGDISGKKVLLIGAGGVARAIGVAVLDLGGDLTITNRTPEKATNVASSINCKILPWENISSFSGHLLINATPVGMGEDKMAVTEQTIANFEVVQDVVMSPQKTTLLKAAEKLGKTIIPGGNMCIHQAAKQFEIYTGEKPPESLLQETRELLQKK